MNSPSLISSVSVHLHGSVLSVPMCVFVFVLRPVRVFVSVRVFMHVCTPFIIFEGASVFLLYVCISESLRQQNSSLFWQHDRGTSSLPMRLKTSVSCSESR